MGITKATHDTDRRGIADFEQIINVGPAIADDFRLLGFQSPTELIGQNPVRLYQKLCQLTGVRQDPCVLDVFIATVEYMNGQPPQPWWHYTAQRKERYHDVYAAGAFRPPGSTPT